MYIYMYVCMYVLCMYVLCMYVCTYVSMYICMYVCFCYEMKYVLQSCSSCFCNSCFLQNTSTLNITFVQFSAHATALLHTILHYSTHYSTTAHHIALQHTLQHYSTTISVLVLSHNYLTLSIYPNLTFTFPLSRSPNKNIPMS